jgi:hypothetical protein
MQQVTCYVHQGVIQREFAHEHHKKPRAAGGDDSKDNLVWLCPSCHDNMHRIATMLLSGNREKADSLAHNGYKNVRARRRLFELSEYVAAAMQRKRDGEEDAIPELQRVTMDLPVPLVDALKQLARSCGSRTKDGKRKKRTGFAKYMQAVLRQHARDNGMIV